MIAKRPLSSVHSSASRVQGPTSRIQSPILASRVQGFRYAQEIRGLLPWLFERCLYLELFSSAFSNIWTRITPNTDTFNVVHKNIKYFCCFIHLLMKMLPSKMLQKPFFFFCFVKIWGFATKNLHQIFVTDHPLYILNMIYYTIICTFILHITAVYFERLLSCKQHFLMKVFSRGKNKGPKSEVTRNLFWTSNWKTQKTLSLWKNLKTFINTQLTSFSFWFNKTNIVKME